MVLSKSFLILARLCGLLFLTVCVEAAPPPFTCQGVQTDVFGNDARKRADDASNNDGVTDTVIVLDTEVDTNNVYKIGCCAQVKEWEILTWKLDVIKLQIWRPTGNTDEYQLVGEHAYTPTAIDKTRQTVIPTDTIFVQPGDVMGWTGNSLRSEENCCTDTDYALYLFKKANLVNFISATHVIDEPVLTPLTPTSNDRKNYAIEMTVEPRPDPECFITLTSASIVETTIGTTIGSVSTNDTLGTYTYTVTSPVGVFTVDANGNIVTIGNLTVPSPPADENYPFTIEISNLCNVTADCSATQVVTDINYPIMITSLPATTTVPETATTALTTHTILTYDMDRNDATDNPVCSLISPVGGQFVVVADGSNPLLHHVKTITNPGFVFATTPQHLVSVGCTDSVNTSFTATATLTVNVVDNIGPSASVSNPIVIDGMATKAGKVVFQLFASDPEGNAITYNFTKWDPASPFAFSDTGSRGCLLNSTTLDACVVIGNCSDMNHGLLAKRSAGQKIYATADLASQLTLWHNFTIMIEDAYNTPTPVDVFINLEGANDVPRFINCPLTVPLPEDTPYDSTVTAYSVLDDNYVKDGQQYLFTADVVPSTYASTFTVDSANGNIYVNNAPPYINYETTGTDIVVKARVTDGLHYATSTCEITITITDVPEAPICSTSTPSIYINEAWANVSLPLNIPLNITVSDADNGETHTYSIISGNTDGRFYISPTSGEISMVKNCDREATCTGPFNLGVQVKDKDGLTCYLTFRIDVRDVNDNAATFDSPSYAIEVSSETPILTTLVTVVSTDADIGWNSQLTCSLSGAAAESSYFTMNNAGQIMLTKTVDFQDDYSFTMTVCCKDAGTPKRQNCVNVVITHPKQTSETTTSRSKAEVCFTCTPKGVAIVAFLSGLALLAGTLGFIFALRRRRKRKRVVEQKKEANQKQQQRQQQQRQQQRQRQKFEDENSKRAERESPQTLQAKEPPVSPSDPKMELIPPMRVSKRYGQLPFWNTNDNELHCSEPTPAPMTSLRW